MCVCVCVCVFVKISSFSQIHVTDVSPCFDVIMGEIIVKFMQHFNTNAMGWLLKCFFKKIAII